MENITNLPLHSIQESPFNPRKTFNQAALEELADSIRAQGIMSPIVVRALPNSLHYQIVFGHRRFRAAWKAELDCIPAIIRDLSDEQVKIAQLHENLEREDVSAVEEADAFSALMRDHGVTAEQLIKQTGKSKSYIYGRLKLVGLCAAVREACATGLPTDVAIKIGRMPSEGLQTKALQKVQVSKGVWHPVRYALSLLDSETFSVSLCNAIFPLTVINTNPEAGHLVSCEGCQYNSSNDPSLESLGAAACTDTDCFKLRTEAFSTELEREHEAQGGTVLRGPAAEGEAHKINWPLQYSRAAVSLSKEIVPGKTIQSVLDEMGEQAPELVVARVLGGHAEKLLPYSALDMLREHLGIATAQSTPPSAARADHGGEADADEDEDEDSDTPAGQLALPLTPEEQACRSNWNPILKAMMRAAVGRRRTVEELRLIVELAMDAYSNIPALVAEVLGWSEELEDLTGYGEDIEWLTRKMPTMSADELASLLVLLALNEGSFAHLTFNATRMAAQVALAKSYGIDPLNPDAAPAEPSPTPPTAAQAPKGGSSGRGAAAKANANANASLDLGDPLPMQGGDDQAGFAGRVVDGAGSADAPPIATSALEGCEA
jgi:ParB/RepB/Spo0J family partition protein